MMNRFKKVLSILCAIALLATAAVFAEEMPEGSVPETVITEEEISQEPTQEQPAVADPVADVPVAETEPQSEPAADPVTDAATEPESEPEPQSEPAADPVTDAATEPTSETEPQSEPAADPVTDAVTEPASETEPQSEPATDAETEPSSEPDPEQTEVQPENVEPAEQSETAETDATNPEQGTSGNEPSGSSGNELVELDEGWGYVDPEVISENVPEITDELKGLRYANLSVGGTLSDTVDFDEELSVTLSTGDAQTVDLKLYVAAGAAMNIKVDGKAAGFTPATSDDPSMTMTVYELDNVSGRSLEIVLTTNDKVSFKLAAIEKQTEVAEESSNYNVDETEPTSEAETEPEQATGNNEEENADPQPAGNNEEENTESQPVENNGDTTESQPEETEQITTQAMKTYDSMKVGESLSDNLAAGQQAKIQVKCGKNPFVTLTLQDSPNALSATIEDSDVQFSRTSEGVYTAEFENVAFRKFNIVLTAKQALDFTLTAEAIDEVETAETEESAEPEAVVGDEEANDTEANSGTEETADSEEDEIDPETPEQEEPEQSEETANESSETVNPETDDDQNEETVAENTEDGNTENAEITPEGTEIVTDSPEETENAETEEPEPVIPDEVMLEMGYIKVQIAMQNGADIFQEKSDEAEAIDHLDAGEIVWVKLTDDLKWASIYSEEDVSRYIKWDDTIIVLMGEIDFEESIARSVTVKSTLDGLTTVKFNTQITMEAELHDFKDEDICEFQWYYSTDGKTYNLVEGANEAIYEYNLDKNNCFFAWRVAVTIRNE